MIFGGALSECEHSITFISNIYLEKQHIFAMVRQRRVPGHSGIINHNGYLFATRFGSITHWNGNSHQQFSIDAHTHTKKKTNEKTKKVTKEEEWYSRRNMCKHNVANHVLPLNQIYWKARKRSMYLRAALSSRSMFYVSECWCWNSLNDWVARHFEIWVCFCAASPSNMPTRLRTHCVCELSNLAYGIWHEWIVIFVSDEIGFGWNSHQGIRWTGGPGAGIQVDFFHHDAYAKSIFLPSAQPNADFRHNKYQIPGRTLASGYVVYSNWQIWIGNANHSPRSWQQCLCTDWQNCIHGISLQNSFIILSSLISFLLKIQRFKFRVHRNI